MGTAPRGELVSALLAKAKLSSRSPEDWDVAAAVGHSPEQVASSVPALPPMPFPKNVIVGLFTPLGQAPFPLPFQLNLLLPPIVTICFFPPQILP